MPVSSTNAIRAFAFPATAGADFGATSAEVEREVVALFGEFRDSLLRYVLSVGLSMQDGEEITQEVFLALFRHLRRGKARQNLRGWLYCVAHNLALKRRFANRRLRFEAEANGPAGENRLDPSPNPEELALFAQRQKRLRAVLRALPEQDQYCLRLRAEGLRYREISRVLGISLGAVSISLTRSLARLACGDRQ